ncbi:MAG: hypothetical protein KGJ86_04785 [Chloroflexota bacterium]|nr:hypothetical protein [Chloroflexota bacterium]
MATDAEEREEPARSRQEDELERLYEQPLPARDRREGLRRLGKRYRRWQ